MKVICIDFVAPACLGLGPVPEFLETLTVTCGYKEPDGEWYTFREYPGYKYEQKGFIPLSNIDELASQHYYEAAIREEFKRKYLVHWI